MLRQLRLLYMRSNKIIRMFQFCTIDLSWGFFKSFCTSFYCSIYGQGTKNQLLRDCVYLSIMYIDKILTFQGVVVPVECMQLMVFII